MTTQHPDSFIDRLRIAAVWQQASGWPQRKADMTQAARIRSARLHAGLRDVRLSDAVYQELLHALRGPSIHQRATLCELIIQAFPNP